MFFYALLLKKNGENFPFVGNCKITICFLVFADSHCWIQDKIISGRFAPQLQPICCLNFMLRLKRNFLLVRNVKRVVIFFVVGKDNWKPVEYQKHSKIATIKPTRHCDFRTLILPTGFVYKTTHRNTRAQHCRDFCVIVESITEATI